MRKYTTLFPNKHTLKNADSNKKSNPPIATTSSPFLPERFRFLLAETMILNNKIICAYNFVIQNYFLSLRQRNDE